MIRSANEVCLVDPIRDSELYEQYIQKENLTLKAIFITHFHADFTSAHYSLARKYNVPVYMGDLQKEFPGLIKCDNDSTIRVGNQDIKIMYTPGHTLESACFLMDKYIFTGDTLFLGEVGRVDLSQSDDSTSMSRVLWNSLQAIK